MEIITIKEWRTLFATRLTKMMADKNINVPQLSAKSDVAEHSIYYYLNEERVPTMPTVYKLAKVFDVSPAYLLGVDPSPYVTAKQRKTMTKREYREELSRRILKVLDKTEMSQSDFARKANIAHSNISNYVGCKVAPDAYGMYKIISGFVDVCKLNKKYLTDFALDIVETYGIEDKTWRDDFASKLRLLMDEQNLSQTKLSRITGIGVATINKYLNSVSNASVINVIRLAKVLNVDINELLCMEGMDAWEQDMKS